MDTNIILFICLSAFGVQQLVETVSDPICTVWIRGAKANSKILSKLTELEARTYANAFFSNVFGFVVCLWSGQGLLKSLVKMAPISPYHGWNELLPLDVLITSLVIGAGTNGANSLLKSLSSFPGAITSTTLDKDANPAPMPESNQSSGPQSPQRQQTNQKTFDNDNLQNSSASLSHASLQKTSPLVQSDSLDDEIERPLDVLSTGGLSEKITFQPQMFTNWCWAAVASMVSDYCLGTSMKQMDVATTYFSSIEGIEIDDFMRPCINAVNGVVDCPDEDNCCNSAQNLETVLEVLGLESFIIELNDSWASTLASYINGDANTKVCPVFLYIQWTEPWGDTLDHYILLIEAENISAAWQFTIYDPLAGAPLTKIPTSQIYPAYTAFNDNAGGTATSRVVSASYITKNN